MKSIATTIKSLCKPSIIYLVFAVSQILFDIYGSFYELAFVKLIVSVIITLMLNTLCKSGLSFVAWLFIFIPFMLMTVVVSILLLAISVNPNESIKLKNKDMTPMDKLRDEYDQLQLEYGNIEKTSRLNRNDENEVIKNKKSKSCEYSEYCNNKNVRKRPTLNDNENVVKHKRRKELLVD